MVTYDVKYNFTDMFGKICPCTIFGFINREEAEQFAKQEEKWVSNIIKGSAKIVEVIRETRYK